MTLNFCLVRRYTLAEVVGRKRKLKKIPVVQYQIPGAGYHMIPTINVPIRTPGAIDYCVTQCRKFTRQQTTFEKQKQKLHYRPAQL